MRLTDWLLFLPEYLLCTKERERSNPKNEKSKNSREQVFGLARRSLFPFPLLLFFHISAEEKQ